MPGTVLRVTYDEMSIAALQSHPPQRRWTWIDSLAIVLVLMIGGATRTIGFTSPSQKVFDEAYYAADACILVLGHGPPCDRPGADIVLPVHPPLGMALIGVGIRVFGFRPGAWRLASLGAGIATIALVYVLARLILRSSLGATVAAGLLALDFLHIVHSRLAMLEVFVGLFGIATFVCLLFDRRQDVHPPGERARVRDHPWRLAAGFMAAAAVATKWTGLAVLAAALGLTLAWEVSRRSGSRRVRAVLREEGRSLAVAFVAVPFVVYVLSFVGTIEGSLLAWPWSEGSWVRAFLADQWRMLRFHFSLNAAHVYGSAAWSWPLLKRPVVFFYEPAPNGYREVLAFGSPLVWWSSLVALAWLIVGWLRQRAPRDDDGLIVAGFLISWLPWFALAPIRSGGFLFYLLPSVPFMCLALGWAATRLVRHRLGVAAVTVFCVAAVGVFAFYRPLLYASPIALPKWDRRVLFRDCGLGGLRLADITLPPNVKRPVDAPGPYPEALLRPGPSPNGWCWI